MNEIESLKTMLEQKKQRADLNAERERLIQQEPVQPNYFECLEDAQAFLEKQNAHKAQLDKVSIDFAKINKAIDKTEATLKKAIPVSNCWIKVEIDGKVYGIGKYINAWGGARDEVIFDEWCDEMKDNPPQDRLEYS